MQLPFFNRWHPLLAIRYLPVVRLIKSNESVLEVGSGSLGIGPYLKRSFIGLDLDFAGPVWPKMTKITASATNLPFPASSIDVVISLDMLEHLLPHQRHQAISEMFRVAKRQVIIGVPIGRLSFEQDKLLDRLFNKTHGHRHHFLQEQVSYGLPTKIDILTAIDKSAKKYHPQYTLTTIPNLNLHLRFWLMKGWINTNFLINVFFRKLLLFALPILLSCNQPPVYRQIFAVKLQ